MENNAFGLGNAGMAPPAPFVRTNGKRTSRTLFFLMSNRG